MYNSINAIMQNRDPWRVSLISQVSSGATLFVPVLYNKNKDLWYGYTYMPKRKRNRYVKFAARKGSVVAWKVVRTTLPALPYNHTVRQEINKALQPTGTRCRISSRHFY